MLVLYDMKDIKLLKERLKVLEEQRDLMERNEDSLGAVYKEWYQEIQDIKFQLLRLNN